MKLYTYKNLIAALALFAMTLTACGEECKTCVANGSPDVVDQGLVCPEDYTSSEAFDTFIKQYEVSGGVCN